MTNDELRLLWARWLAADPLTSEEQRALAAALDEDAELRDSLLDDLDLDGALRGLAEGRRRADAFNRTMAGIVAPERDATRFIRKVEAALAGPSPKPPSSSKLPAVRATHRFTRRARQGESDAIAWKVGVAAAFLFALVVMAAVARPKPPMIGKPPAPLPRLEDSAAAPEPEPSREPERKPRSEPEPKSFPPAPERKPDRTESEPGKLEVPPARRPAPAAPPAPIPPPDRPSTTAERAVALEAPKVVDGIVWRRVGSLVEFNKGDALPFEQELKAHDLAPAELRWADTTHVALEKGSRFRLSGRERRVQLLAGQLESSIAPQDPNHPMFFEGPNAEAKIVGTKIRMTVSSEGGATSLLVREGVVEFKRLSDGKAVVVKAGEFAVCSAAGDLKTGRAPAEDEIRFVFGPGDTRYDAARFKHDSGQVFDAARGYGWKSSDYAKVDWNGAASGHVGPGRNTPSKAPEAHRLGHVAAGWGVHTDTWTMPMPNGKYLVTVGVGDWCVEHGPNRVTVEGLVIVNDVITKKATNYYAEFTAEVVVKDGELTMVCGGSESKRLPQDGSLDTILNYLVIRKAK